MLLLGPADSDTVTGSILITSLKQTLDQATRTGTAAFVHYGLGLQQPTQTGQRPPKTWKL